MCCPALKQSSPTETSSSDRQKEANKVGEGGGNFNACFVFFSHIQLGNFPSRTTAVTEPISLTEE